MCGINGIFGKRRIKSADIRISKMNNSIIHRGPDAEGVYLSDDERVGLGHRRLAVIDVEERSNQPMNTERGVLVYNGEIYNYKELREELTYSFQTKSDTEVLMIGIEQKGITYLLEKCNGMFAFAYYDKVQHELILARDRMGIKPLYYYYNDDILIFSSEIKGILNSGLINAEFNEEAIDEYLGNRYIREPYTFFKDIYQVPAGCYIRVDCELKVEVAEYWKLPEEFNLSTEYNEEEIFCEFKKQVVAAIERRMIADVPLGTYLSGGIDSGIITAIASQIAGSGINTYTIGFQELNEFRYAKQVADYYKTNHHELLVSLDDYIQNMEEVISYKDAPLGVPNEIPLTIMSRELKKDITVVLSGEGADELLGGYGRIFRAPFDFDNIEQEGEFYDYFIKKYEYVPRRIRNEFLQVKKPLRDYFDNNIKMEFSKRTNEENVFRFFHQHHVKGLLQRVDVTTMLTGVEARVPFLDHELIEFSYKAIPYELKLKWKSEEAKRSASKMNASQYSEKLDFPKYLLRRLGNELLPKEVVSREKMGFPVPLDEWFEQISNMAREVLKEAYWIRKECLDELIRECQNTSRAGQILWMFLNVELFRKMYFEKDWRY